jgi:hypothetical protein
MLLFASALRPSLVRRVVAPHPRYPPCIAYLHFRLIYRPKEATVDVQVRAVHKGVREQQIAAISPLAPLFIH